MRLYPIPSLLLISSFTAFAQAGSVFSHRRRRQDKARRLGNRRAHHGSARSRHRPTDKSGAFLLPGLPAGAYRICAQIAGGGYLDPCEWSGYATSALNTVNVLAGQTVGGFRIQLQSASSLQIRIDDPQKLLDPAHPERDMMIGVFSGNGLFHRATLKSAGTASRLHEVWIPFDAPLKLHISSAQLSLTDDKGAPVAAGTLSVPVTRSKSGQAIPPIAVTVTGIKHP